MSKKTEELLNTLQKQWAYPTCAFLVEVRGGTGWGRESRVDALAMHLWPSEGLELIGFEVKVSRADWLREVKNPEKADPMKQFCDRWYLVTYYEGDVRHDEIPKDWGWMSRDYMGKIVMKREAPKLEPKPIDRLFLAAIMRRASNPFDEVVIDGRKYKALI